MVFASSTHLGGRDGLRQAPAAIRISRRLVGLLELALVIGAPLLRGRLAGLFGLKTRLIVRGLGSEAIKAQPSSVSATI